jgi:hypothetical protein
MFISRKQYERDLRIAERKGYNKCKKEWVYSEEQKDIRKEMSERYEYLDQRITGVSREIRKEVREIASDISEIRGTKEREAEPVFQNPVICSSL